MARLKKRFLMILAAVLLCGAVLVVWHAFAHHRRQLVFNEEEEEKGEGKGDAGPNDYFMVEREWPSGHIAMEDYLAASHQAERLSARATLDDPPWVPAGPSNIGGRVADVVSDPAHPNRIYAAAATGGIWKTTNGGNTWLPVFDQAPSQSMGALAIDLQHPDTIYAGTGEPNASGISYFGTGVYRTTDGGATWANIGLPNSRYISRIVLDTEDTQSIWVAVVGEFFGTNPERGIYHTTDGGMNWQRMLFVNDSTGACDVVLHPTNPQIVYAAMWQRIHTSDTRVAGGRGSGVFRSTNGGETWARLTGGLPAQGDSVGRIGLAICQSSPNVLYAKFSDDPGYYAGTFRTTNGGDTWSRTNDADLALIENDYGWYFGNIRVRPDNPDVVFVLGMDMYRSMNGGQEWSHIASDVHVDHHAMWFDTETPTTILNGNDGGVYRSVNNGDSWSFLPGIPNNQFYAATVDAQHPERRYGGTQDQGTLRTITGGTNDWQVILGGDGFYVLVDPSDTSIIYAEYYYGYLGRSDDGGQTFWDATNGFDLNERINWSMPIAFAPDNPSVLYAGLQHVYRTTNRGDNWAPISPDLTSGPGNGNLVFGTVTTIGVSAVNPNVIYAGTDDAHVWVTRDGGTNWTNISAGLPQQWVTRVTPDPVDSNVVFVTQSGFRNVDENAHLFYSTDFGTTWQNISGNLPSGPLNDVVRDPALPGRLFVGSDFGAYYSNDLGANWMTLGLNMPHVPVNQLVLNSPSHQLLAATYGRSMYTLDVTQLAVDKRAHTSPSSYLLLSVYPNPFNSVTNIDFDFPRAGQAEIAIFDLTGRRVTTLLQGFQPAGHARLQWPAQNVASGSYFVRLTMGGQTRITKALLIR